MFLRSKLTVVHAAAEATLVPPPSLDELHEGAHVGFAPVASDWSGLSVIHQVQGSLREASPVSMQAPRHSQGPPQARGLAAGCNRLSAPGPGAAQPCVFARRVKRPG